MADRSAGGICVQKTKKYKRSGVFLLKILPECDIKFDIMKAAEPGKSARQSEMKKEKSNGKYHYG